MNFASNFVLNDAAEADRYEVVSDDEFNEGMELSDSDSDESERNLPASALRLSSLDTVVADSALPSPPPPGLPPRAAAPPPTSALDPAPPESSGRSGLGRLMDMFRGGSSRSESNSKHSKPKGGKMRSWKSERPYNDLLGSTADKGDKKKRVFRRAHTNVVSIRFDTLKKPSAMHAGEAILCSECQAIMSNISPIVEDGPDKVWKCEFCDTRNVVDIEEEEKPVADDVTYLMEPGLTTASMTTSGRDESIVVFCIDTSGSMTITTEVPGHMKLRGRSDTLRRLQRECSMEGPQRLPREARNVTYISRLQAVQAAVDHQLGEMAKDFPDRRIALITFDCEVRVIGDGTSEVVTVTGEKLNDKEELARIGATLPLPKPVKETRASLGEKVFGLEEGGSTALGPALIVALSLASQHSGSKVIVCTDGKSNEGVGKVENLADDESGPDEFYETVATSANSKGVSMSVVTIQGTDCKLIHLGKLADSTGGQVNIVDPLKLTEEFSNVLADRIIATNVVATFILHRGMYIGREENEASMEKREIGNVRSSQEISFEYGVRRKKGKKSPKKSPARELSRISEVPSVLEGSLRPQSGVQENLVGGEGDAKRDSREKMDTAEPTEPSSSTPEAAAGASASGADAGASAEDGEGNKDSAESDIPPELPFQLQIQYTDADGTKALRVLTQKMPVTTDREVAEKHADLAVLGVHTERLSSELALQGDYSGSRGVALMNQRLAWRSSRESAPQQKMYKAAFSRVRTVENRVQHQQQYERSTYGRTHSDEEDEAEEADSGMLGADLGFMSAMAAPLSAGGGPGSKKKVFKKKQMRSAEAKDDFAYDLYQARSSSSSNVPYHRPSENKDKDKDKDRSPTK